MHTKLFRTCELEEAVGCDVCGNMYTSDNTRMFGLKFTITENNVTSIVDVQSCSDCLQQIHLLKDENLTEFIQNFSSDFPEYFDGDDIALTVEEANALLDMCKEKWLENGGSEEEFQKLLDEPVTERGGGVIRFPLRNGDD